MASYYVYHAAAGAGTGADWTNAFTRLNTAMTGRAAGDVFYVAHDHSETAATATVYTSPGTEVAPCFVYCVDRAGSVPPVAADLRTTATISTTLASTITLSGMVRECYGIIFNSGSGANISSITVGASLMTWRMVNCGLRLGATGGTSRINMGVNGAYTIFENCTVQFASITQGFTFLGRNSIRGPSTTSFITGATIPTGLFFSATATGSVSVEGVDFSAVSSGKSLVISSSTATINVVFKDCKLGAGNIVAGSPAIPGTGSVEVVAIRCDDGDVNYRSEKHNRSGRQLTETTIVRSGGATDGTTPISWWLQAGNPQGCPFEALPISIWNEAIGSPITVTIEAFADTTIGAPTNKDIWMEVEYLGVSGVPLGMRATTGVASTLDTGTSYPSGSGIGTWGGSGAGDVSFAMSVTITPEEKGPITIYVMVATVSDQYYIDPKPVIS